jgi:RNA polymerase sigma factor (sigma-70 family)
MFAPSLETTALIGPEVGRDAGTELDRALEIFLSQRTRLFRVAYRVIGDVSGAEDVVQEAWLRWQRTNRGEIKNPAAFLTTTTTHLAINVIQSARHRHETPTESPLADLVDPAQDPTVRAEQGAAVDQILSTLMARLTPAEFAAYLLRKGFDYPYGDIAKVLRTSVPNARQLVHRAQLRIEGDRERSVDPDAHRLLVRAFLAAGRNGDLEGLERLLAQTGCPTAGCASSPSRGPVRREHRPTPSRSA